MQDLILPVVTTLIAVWGAVEAFMRRYENIISYITHGIEEYSIDGEFTSAEKEKLAIDTWRNEVKPNLPAKLWWIKLIPNVWIEKLIRDVIAKICAEAKKINVSANVPVEHI